MVSKTKFKIKSNNQIITIIHNYKPKSKPDKLELTIL